MTKYLSETEMNQKLKIGAFIVAYKDHQALDNLLLCIAAQTRALDSVLIIDNSPEPIGVHLDAKTRLNYQKAFHPENLGISGALRVAQKWAERNNIDWIWMFDQDSEPQNEALEVLLNHLNNVGTDSSNIGILSCGIFSENSQQPISGYYWNKYQYIATSAHLDRKPYFCDAVISSGSLINVAKWSQIAPIEEKLFIDFVDFQLCRNFRMQGFKIMVVPEARLRHKLGEPQEVKMPFKQIPKLYYHLSATRVFHICRNQSFIELSGSKVYYWPLVFKNRLRHLLYFVVGALFSKKAKVKIIFAAFVGFFLGFLSPKLWPAKFFQS